MTKSTTIFENKSELRQNLYTPQNEDLVTISRNDYRELLKAAYQEGLKDAGKEKRKKGTSSKNAKEEIQEEGRKDAVRTHAKEKEANRQRFETITARQDIELFHQKSVFPFSLFPDTLIIDTTKVTIAKKQLFATEYITTIPLKDLSDVNVQTALFLATITIKYMPQSASPGMNEAVEVKIPNLRREDAIKAKNILKGALVAKAEEIDIAKLSPEEIDKVLHKFGESNGVI
jgi:hypothetical protein